jgi:Protein of unknown function (DUF3592)
MFIYNPAKYENPWHIHIARIFSLLILLAGLWLWCSAQLFIHFCSTTTGTISENTHSLQLSSGSKYEHGNIYNLNYAFSANGKNYSGRDSLDYDPGKIVTVYYNRRNPANNRLDEPDTSIPRNMIILGILFTLGLFPWSQLRKKPE